MLKEQLEAVLGSGLQPEVYFSGFVLDRLAPKDAERVSRALREKQVPVTFHAPFMDLNPGAADERVREVTVFRFGQVLDLVPLFQPRMIVLHPVMIGGGTTTTWTSGWKTAFEPGSL